MEDNRLTDYFNFDDIMVNDMYSIFSGQTNYFMAGDSEEVLKKNLIKQPYDWHYRTKEITYKINSYGYRTKEFNEIDWKESIVIFGCSHVFGIGLAEDETLSYNISQITGRNVVNLGVPGGSNYMNYYNSIMMKKKYGIPYAVIFIWTDFNRYSYFTKKELVHLGSWSYNINDKKSSVDEKKQSTFYSVLVSDLSHNQISGYFLLESIREFWKDKTTYREGQYFLEDKYFNEAQLFPTYEYEFARDLGHPGRDTNKVASEMLTRDLK